MTVAHLADMTWEDVRELDAARTVAILPIGAVEAHGPHLPLATDVIIAEAMARAGAANLDAGDIAVFVLPALSYTPADFAATFPGTVSMHKETLTALLLDIARSLTRQGFPMLALANAHLDPANLGSIETAQRAARAENLLAIVFPDVSKKPWALRLTEEFKSGACHAGRYETSVVMAARPELVREDIRGTLPPNPASLSDAIRAGLKNFEDAQGPQAYFGYPADATAAEGERTIAVLGTILEQAILAEWPE
ncbi:MAG: creatininase family protein [Gemmatimonadetes bacterium]|nr:creatininase family protein [Gemmatimonadota bacterium]